MLLHLRRLARPYPFAWTGLLGKAVHHLSSVMAPSSYFAYHVDLYGTARASYGLQATNDSSAVSEARYFLKFHPTLEVWQGARWVARLLRDEPAKV